MSMSEKKALSRLGEPAVRRRSTKEGEEERRRRRRTKRKEKRREGGTGRGRGGGKGEGRGAVGKGEGTTAYGLQTRKNQEVENHAGKSCNACWEVEGLHRGGP